MICLKCLVPISERIDLRTIFDKPLLILCPRCERMLLHGKYEEAFPLGNYLVTHYFLSYANETLTPIVDASYLGWAYRKALKTKSLIIYYDSLLEADFILLEKLELESLTIITIC